MNFLFPNILYALSLVSIPIIIHFFNFQRAKKVYFTNVAFLQSVKSVTNSRNRIKNILVLLARILFIAMLVLAFARPFLPNKTAGADMPNSNYVSIYFDNSYSLQNELEGRRLFDVAVNHVDEISNLFPNNALFQLLDNSFENSSNYFMEKDRVQEKLLEKGFSNNGRQLANVLAKQKEAFASNGMEKGNHIFWISDFQRSSIGELSELAMDTLNNFYIIPMLPDQNTNLFIDSVWLETPFVKAKENSVLKVRVVNLGDEDVTEKGIKLSIDDKQVSSTTVDIAAGLSETVNMNFSVGEGGEKRCKLEVEDFPVIFDNEYFFVIKVAPEIRIVKVAATENSYVESVFANEPFFKLTSYGIDALDYSALNTADLIILEGLREIDNALLASLQRVMGQGATVVVFPSPFPDLPSYTSLLGFPPTQQEVKALPIPEEEMLSMTVPDQANPFFEGVFEKVSANMSMPKGFPTITWQAPGQTLLRFRNELPFLTEMETTGQKLYVFSSPLDPAFSNFPKHALFVPTMYKIALASKIKNDRLSYSFNDQVAIVSLDSVNQNDVFRLVGEQAEIIPSQRIVDSRLMIDVPHEEIEAGNYQLKKMNDEKVYGNIAFNYDNSESSLEYYSMDELKEVFGEANNIQFFETPDAADFRAEFSNQNVATPLWRYALLLALLFLLIEVLLIRFWKTA
ncbi:BatA domain-containing protein [Flammeovirgaceae bacterium SG7u.111]|nr:BatA domain-containing protein [Flammeovirgaceae bacterium SG7u.132]WPO33823.1 BatA domain-containing protein [Flammeovirgaceae bacterium SG7u.111]